MSIYGVDFQKMGVLKGSQISTKKSLSCEIVLFNLVCPLVSPSISAAFGPVVGLNSGISLKMDGWNPMDGWMDGWMDIVDG